jgi:hypothetical protein
LREILVLENRKLGDEKMVELRFCPECGNTIVCCIGLFVQ